ncbi:sulfite exporter TauE/SafE family protein [Alteromonas sp. CYL-A6]|uniref:sulfite exporter TauE/SafE family protein n=1 Tax=Alteromonas nitratireducens TaxID=3390813 RepID=UPI003982FFC0
MPVRQLVFFLLIAGWLTLVVSQPDWTTLASDFGGFGLLGVVGAIFANATGAGGGVIFVPFFNYLNFSALAIVATSFAIQCCGMTAGALSWAAHARQQTGMQWSPLRRGLLLTVPASLCGIWLAQYGADVTPGLAVLKGNLDNLHLGFGLFSVFLALAIYGSVFVLHRVNNKTQVTLLDTLALPAIGFVGGIVTAWLSVGVGELVAVYLIIRGFNVTMSIALAVILTACSVWGAITYHLFVTGAIVTEVVLFAGAGAVVGGIVARHVVLAFSARRLKLFFATWVLLMGLGSLPIY